MRPSNPAPSLVVALALAGCSVDATFACQDDLACEGVGPVGQCEPSGYCSFADPDCDSGRRYGTLAGDGLGGSCVDPLGGTGPSTTGPVDPPADTGSSSSGVVDDTGPLDVGWWDCQWAARRRLTVDPVGLDEELSAVPVLIVLDPTRIDPSIMAPNGQDLRFVGDDGTSLSYEIEQWAPSGLSWIWLSLPQLGPGGTSLDMYYGQPGAPALDGAEVWAGYAGVWHMDADVADSTGLNELAEVDATTAPGQIASAQQFTSSSDGVHIFPGAPADVLFDGGGTITAMIRAAGWGNSGRGPIVSRTEDSYGNDGWAFQIYDDREALRFGRGFTDERGTWFSPDGSIRLHTWHHVALVYDDLGRDAEPEFFIDGVAQPVTTGTMPYGFPEDYDDEYLHIGGDPDSSSLWFDGTIDEVRMIGVPRTEGWMRVQAASQRDDLVTYGPQQSAPCGEP